MAQQKRVALFLMGAQPLPQTFRNGEGNQIIGNRQEFELLLLDPVGGVVLAALRTGAMVAGMIDKVVLTTVDTAKHLATQRRGAAIEDCLHRPAMRGKERGAKLPFILRPILAQHLGQRDHRTGFLS